LPAARMARFAAVAAALALAPAACGKDAPPAKNAPPAPVVVRADQGAILKGVAGRGIFDQCTRDRPANVQGFWDPSPQDVKRLEEDLATYLRTHKLPDSSQPVQQSWRQYAGFVRWGRKLIYVNAFPGPLYPGDYWKREAEEVCAGGPAYYGIVYDPDARTFGEMKFNPGTKDWSKKR
ncbi:MAG: secreted protein, partial [Gemmatimonadetes bacterium]|nr:secreted protein [Gemmatimonadota bacterium]